MPLIRPGGRPAERGPAAGETPAHSFYDPSFGMQAVKVLPGAHHVTDAADHIIVTVLGSCIAACVRDPKTGRGGMNHFMLPESSDGMWGRTSAAMRYGNFAMERLINEVLSPGGHRQALEIKVFGGSTLISDRAGVGLRNADFVEAYLREEHIPIRAHLLRCSHALRVVYFPATGRVLVKELREEQPEATAVLAEEGRYRKRLPSVLPAGEVELFG